jgi:hypothetical protein
MELTEKVLKELGLWEKAKQNCINEYDEDHFNYVILNGGFEKISEMFVWNKTEEGHDFWYNIEKTHNI